MVRGIQKTVGKKYIYYALCVLVGFLLGLSIYFIYRHAEVSDVIQIREDSNEYTYINPLLFIDHSENVEFKPLKKVLEDYVSYAEKSESVEDISVYFRELNSGHWTGVNENDLYTPSSMLKVALMISYFKEEEQRPDLLSQSLLYSWNSDDANEGQYYKPTHNLDDGYHTIDELIHAMIIDSDNVATLVLFRNNKEAFQSTYNIFRLPPTALNEFSDYMSPKSYSVLFRSLYSSTYLSRADSEKSLELLTQTTFQVGLVAGVPEGTMVAHKFGEHTYGEEGGEQMRELHDCGIIYKSENPYFLCVMTKGREFSELEKVISDISKLVFENDSTSTSIQNY